MDEEGKHDENNENIEMADKNIEMANKKIWDKNLRNHLKQYCDYTSIHGFKYFADGSSIFEKLIWGIVLFISICVCLTFMMKTYEKWKDSPVIVSFATTETPIYHLPFPAVTICPESKFSRRFYNFTDLYRKKKKNIKLNPIEEQDFDYMSMVCKREHLSEYSDFYKREKNITNSEDFYDFMEKVNPEISKHVLSCRWLSFDVPCQEILTPIVTDEGICYTFNMLDRKEMFSKEVVTYGNFLNVNKSAIDWDHKTFQYGSSRVDSYPRRALLAGAKMSLSIWVATFKDDIDYLCKHTQQGFKVLLHHPSKMPRMDYNFYKVPLDRTVFTGISPVMMTTSDSLKSYDPKARGCYFPSERNLKYFKIYSQPNCDMECLANFTLQTCGCSHYYMPRFKNESICGIGSYSCLEKIESDQRFLQVATSVMESKKMAEDYYSKNSESFTSPADLDCNCLPTCISVDYNVEISQTKWNWKETFQVHEFNVSKISKSLTENQMHMSSLVIFFKTNQLLALQRHELYGAIDLLANFGGLLGLFVGFSLISFVEIIYFFTLRLYGNIRTYGNVIWPIGN